MKKIIILLLIGTIFNSCGVFLQNTGVKNYSPKEKISQNGINKYQYDFIYLSRILNEGFPEIDSVFPKTDRNIQEKQTFDNLSKSDIDNLDFIVQARKYLSNLKNQHTTIYLKFDFEKVYPFVIHIFEDNWYLISIDRKKDSLLLRKRIRNINGIPTDEIEKKLIDFTFAENKINQQYEIRNKQFYNKPEYLKAINVIAQKTESITITFEDNSVVNLVPTSTDKEIVANTIKIKENKITKFQNETYLYKIYQDKKLGYLQFNKCHDKIDILDGIESYVKPWLQPIARSYAKKQFKKEKPSKRIAPYYNPKYPVFKDFVWELIDSLNSNNIHNLVIDLRNNPGGNLTLGIQLMYFLTDKKDLKGFSEYAYTSEIYKSYFPDEYQSLKEKHPNGVPQNKLILKEKNLNLFNEITDSTSNYFVPENRPIFRGDIYILSNYRTGSAAAMLTTLFQDNGIGKVIGTSVGNNPIGATTYTPMKLPKTKADISIATTYIERPNKSQGKYQIPDYWIEYCIEDLESGIDPYWEKVQELITKKASR
jgi:hypothetical protein